MMRLINNKRIIQTIYKYCPNLQYLNLMFRKDNIIELENLLINCQYLNGLYVVTLFVFLLLFFYIT